MILYLYIQCLDYNFFLKKRPTFSFFFIIKNGNSRNKSCNEYVQFLINMLDVSFIGNFYNKNGFKKCLL